MTPSLKEIQKWFRARPRRRKRLKYGLIVLAVLMVIIAATRPVSHVVKSWQSRRLASQANDLMKNHQWREASRKSLDALQLHPSEPAAIDSVAHLLSLTGQSNAAMSWWKKIEQTRPLTTADRRQYAAAALDSGELAIATAQIEALIPQGSDSTAAPEDLVLAAQLATLKGRSATALGYAEEVLKDPKAPSRAVFDTIILVLMNTTPQSISYGAAVDRLVEIARNEESPLSLDALRLLAAEKPRPRLTDARTTPLVIGPPLRHKNIITRTEVADLLDKHPNAAVRDKLMALQLRAEADLARAGDYTKTGMEMFTDNNDAIPALAAWLYDRGKYERVLEIVPQSRVANDRALYLWRIDALAALGRFDELKAMLLSEESALDQVSQHAFLAVVSAKSGEPVVATNEWERALEAANSMSKLQFLARYAEANNALQIADRACIEILTQDPHLRSGYLSRLRLAETVGDTTSAQKIAAQIIRLWPEDTATRIREIYLRLLLGGSAADIAEAQHQLDDVSARNSLGWNGRGTLALAYLRNGRPAAALSELDQPTSSAPPPNILAIRAKALAEEGWNDKARQEARKLITAKLLPEERALVSSLLAAK